MDLRVAWPQDLEALCGSHSPVVSAARVVAQRAAETFVDALVKQDYLDNRLSYREMFWFPYCAGFSSASWPAAELDLARLRAACPSTKPFAQVLAQVVLYGGYRWDGHGQTGPSASAIPLIGRMGAVVRTYVENLPPTPTVAAHLAALDIVCARRERELDPQLVELFVGQTVALAQQGWTNSAEGEISCCA